MSMSKAATQGDLEKLHRLVAEALREALQDAPRCPTCGRCGVEPAILRVTARFLADNGIQVDGNELRDMQRSLADLSGLSLPFKPKQ
jgi:hypothetical protein